MTVFVHPDLVRGRCTRASRSTERCPPECRGPIHAMFLIAQVHPFAHGNGRVARTLMNAELSAAGMCRVMVPLSIADEYMSALRALSHNDSPTPMAHDRPRSTLGVADELSDHDRVLELLSQTNALVTPERTQELNLHLLDPA